MSSTNLHSTIFPHSFRISMLFERNAKYTLAFFRNVWLVALFSQLYSSLCKHYKNRDLRKRDILFRFEQNLIIIWVFSLNDAFFLQSVLEGKKPKENINGKMKDSFLPYSDLKKLCNLKCYWFNSHSTFFLYVLLR